MFNPMMLAARRPKPKPPRLRIGSVGPGPQLQVPPPNGGQVLPPVTRPGGGAMPPGALPPPPGAAPDARPGGGLLPSLLSGLGPGAGARPQPAPAPMAAPGPLAAPNIPAPAGPVNPGPQALANVAPPAPPAPQSSGFQFGGIDYPDEADRNGDGRLNANERKRYNRQTGRNAKGIERQIMLQRFQNSQQAYPLLWDAINRLSEEANIPDFERFAEESAPLYQYLQDQFEGAQGDLERDMAARGLESSSGMSGGMAGLRSDLARGRANIFQGVMGNVREEQEAAQDQLRSILAQLATGEADAAAGLGGRRQDRALQKMLAEMQQQGGGFLGDILGNLGGILGNLGGLGFKPFGRSR